MKHKIEILSEGEKTSVEVDLSDAELATFQRVAQAINTESGHVMDEAVARGGDPDDVDGPPWMRIDGLWRWDS